MRISLLRSGLRFRAKSSLALLALAAFSVGAGAFGPIYLHSADQSLLSSALQSAPAGEAGLTLEPAGANGTTPQLESATAKVPTASRSLRWFGRPIDSEIAGIGGSANGTPYVATLESRSGVCAHLDVVSGHCATEPGEIVLSARSADLLGISTGRRFTTSLIHSSRTASFTVVGLYQPDNPQASFWWGSNPFGFGPTTGRQNLDTVFASAATLNASVPVGLISRVVQIAYELGSLRVDDTAQLRSALRSFQHTALSDDQVLVQTQMPQLLASAATEEGSTASIVAVIDLQFILLALIALYFVAANTTNAREPDVRLAALRGYRRRSTLAIALAEPTAIVLAAVPIGCVLAWLFAVATARAFFGSGATASLTLLSVLAAIATGLIGLLSTALGSRRLLALSGANDDNETSATRIRAGRWRVIADVAVVSVAVAAFLELAVVGVTADNGGSNNDPLAASAPALLAVAFGVLVSRALPFLVRPITKSTQYSAKTSWFLAARRYARRRGFATKVILVGVAASLVVFALSGWSAYGRNLDRQTEFATGAATALTVDVAPGVDFLSAVRRADPSSRQAMAVVVDNASDGTTLAVDASRMANVISWPSGLSAKSVAALARQLAPRDLAPHVDLSGSSVRIEITGQFDAHPAPQLVLDLFDNGYGTPEQVALGPLSQGSKTYSASLQGVCVSGCRLVDLALSWAPPASAVSPVTARMLVTSIVERSTGGRWQPVRADLLDAKDWTISEGGVRFSSDAGGLAAALTLTPDGGPVAFAPRDVPQELPVIATPSSEIGSTPGAPLAIVGLDGTTINGSPIQQVSALPRVGNDAVLADLGTAESMMTEPFTFATSEVWLAPHVDVAAMEARLRSVGVTTVAVDSASVDEAQQQHGGSALAYKLFLLAAIGAVLIAVGACGIGLLSEASRRRGELSSLRAFGLSASSLRRSLAAEELLTVGSGIVLGTVSGVLAAAVALKSVPEFVNLGSGAPLEFDLPVLLLLASVAVLAIALGVSVGLTAYLAVRTAKPDQVGGTS